MTSRNPARGLTRLVAVQAGLTVAQSLAGKDAVLLDTTYLTNAEAFLLKRYRIMIDMEVAPLRLNTVCVIPSPGASLTEAEAGIEITVQDPDDFSSWLDILAMDAVIWNSFVALQAPAGHTDNADVAIDSGYVTIGEKGKGVPFAEGHGPQLALYNIGAALPADVIVNFMVIYEGVWLRD